MSRAVLAIKPGGPEVLRQVLDHTVHHPNGEEIMVKMAATGVNTIDIGGEAFFTALIHDSQKYNTEGGVHALPFPRSHAGGRHPAYNDTFRVSLCARIHPRALGPLPVSRLPSTQSCPSGDPPSPSFRDHALFTAAICLLAIASYCPHFQRRHALAARLSAGAWWGRLRHRRDGSQGQQGAALLPTHQPPRQPADNCETGQRLPRGIAGVCARQLRPGAFPSTPANP